MVKIITDIYRTICASLSLLSFVLLLAACGGKGVEDGAVVDDTAGDGLSESNVLRMGSGNGNTFSPGELGSTQINLAAGSSTIITATLVDSSGSLASVDAEVNFSSPCLAAGLSSVSDANADFANGVASIIYTSNGCSGSDVITASSVISDTLISANVELAIEADVVLSMAFLSAEPAQLALRGTGGIETTTLTFKLIGALGAAIPGESVSFELTSSVGGVSIAAGKESGMTNNLGEVSTVIQSGTVSTSVSVLASHDSTGIESSSDSIVISSGAPVDSKFSLALTTSKPSNAFQVNGIEVGVSVIASDYFGNDVPDGTQVFFASPEFGNIDSSCEILSGECSVMWRSSGDRPNDYRATILAYTPGAEDYTDTNGNNVYDSSDTFSLDKDDLAEPYVDENESGEYEPGELFVDTNKNKVRDLGNGLWDGPCLITADPSADCSGLDSVNIWKNQIITLPTNSVSLVSSEVSVDNGSTWVSVPPERHISTAFNSRTKLRFVLADDNLQTDQRIALPTGTTIASSMEDVEFKVTGQTEITVGSKQVYAETITVSIADDNLGVDDKETALNVRVSVPGVNVVIFTWYIDD